MAFLRVFIWSVLICCALGGQPKHTELQLGKESGPHVTNCGEYGYFKVHVEHVCNDLHVELKHLVGEPNIYVSTTEQYPTYKSLAWSSYNWKHDKIVISSWDPAFKTGWYYISIHSYCGEDAMRKPVAAKYTVLVTSQHHVHPDTSDLFNGTASGIVEQQSYNYHRFCVPDKCHKVSVNLQNCISQEDCPKTYAFPELIISRTKDKPTINDYSWKLAEVETRSILLDPRMDAVSPGHYYVSVYGWCTPDEHCEDPAVCGPCQYAAEVAYNVSVVPTSVYGVGCPRQSGPGGAGGLVGGTQRSPHVTGWLPLMAAILTFTVVSRPFLVLV